MAMMLRLTGQRLLTALGCALAGTVLWCAYGHAEDASQPTSVVGAPDTPDSADWAINSDDRFLFLTTETEPSVGTIKHVRSGKTVNTWQTKSLARLFYSPVVLGAFPNQSVVVPYLQGGGTGFAVVHWCVIRPSDRESRFIDMGLCAAWSHGKDIHEFSLNPCFLSLPDGLLFDFRYSHEAGEVTKSIKGKLVLQFQNGDSAFLAPVALEDALSLVHLLDCPLDAVSDWAAAIIQRCLPREAGVQAKVTEAKRQAILEGLRGYFAKRQTGT